MPLRCLLLGMLIGAGMGCGGSSSSGQLPVDSPLVPFEAPEREALLDDAYAPGGETMPDDQSVDPGDTDAPASSDAMDDSPAPGPGAGPAQ